jgi:hypothetical protein
VYVCFFKPFSSFYYLSQVLWQRMADHASSGDLLGCGSTQGRDTDFTPQGIVKGHAYAILQVLNIDGVSLVQLRNPWGTCGWKGRFR